MDRTMFRILDALTRDLGRHVSILELTKKVSGIYGKAYYKNIYDRIQEMAKDGVVKISRAGNASLVSLNFKNYGLFPLLGELENEKKRSFLENNSQIAPLLQEMEKKFRQGFYMLRSILIAGPEKILSRRRGEFLFILADPRQEARGKEEKSIFSERVGIYSIMKMLGNHYNIKLDSLILTESELLSMMRLGDPELAGILSNQIAFFRPDDFWQAIKDGLAKGLVLEWKEAAPGKMPEKDVLYNMDRFGYSEFGTKARGKGSDMPVEYVIVSMLLSGDRRREEGVPVLLVKNKVNYGLLVFLSNKYNTSGRLLGILKAVGKFKEAREINYAIKMLKSMRIKEKKTDAKSIKQKLELYNAI